MRMDDETRRMIEASLDPEMVARFGNPLDESDPRNWTPSKRAKEGLSVEQQFELLALDVEQLQMGLAKVIAMVMQVRQYINEQEKQKFVEQIKNDPEGAINKLMEMLGGGQGSNRNGQWGPLEDKPDASIRYAGSSQGIAPDQMVETPQGLIRADEIPGYRNDPNWMPSPDWIEANCMCPSHVASRENNSNPFGIDPFKDNGPGMYL